MKQEEQHTLNTNLLETLGESHYQPSKSHAHADISSLLLSSSAREIYLFIYRDSWVNGAMDNGSNCLLVQNVAGTERIGLSHSKVAWLMVQEILDNGSILFLFSTSKV